MLITPFFAALFALIYILLSLNVARIRVTNKISIGDGENKELARAARAHANFSEYVPFALILFYFIEIMSFSGQMVFILASVLLVSRILHVIGMLSPSRWLVLRSLGALTTFIVILVACVLLLMNYIPLSNY